VPQVGQLALQGYDLVGFASLTPLVQFPLDTFEFLAQLAQPLSKLSSGGILLPVVIILGPAVARILHLIPDPVQLRAQPLDFFP
jgi:hypothetical protein